MYILAYRGFLNKTKRIYTVNLNVYISITKCFYMGNLCVALRILESHSKDTVMIIVYVFCKWQSVVLIINLDAFLCGIFLLLAYLRKYHHQITCGMQKEGYLSELH